MKVKWEWELSGPKAVRRGEIEIDPKDLEGEKRAKLDELINERIQEHVMQHIDWVYKIVD